MKKLGLILILIGVNLFLYYYVVKYTDGSETYKEISFLILASAIVVCLSSLIPAYISYKMKLKSQKVSVSFKKVYTAICLNVLLGFYSLLMLIGVVIVFN